MKYLLFSMIVVLIFTSCADIITGGKKKKVNISGYVVETFYDEDTIFSVRGLADVGIFHAGAVVAATNSYGRYRLYLPRDGWTTLRAEKENYRSDAQTFELRRDEHRIIDLWLEREDEQSHGWSPFSYGLTGGHLMITPKGLTLYGYGREFLYATRLIELPNNATYRFSAKVLKDVLSQSIYFEVLPQIPEHRGMRQTWTLDKWQRCSFSMEINHVMKELVYENGVVVDTLFIRPPTVDVVLKVGVGGATQNPLGYFNEIRVVRE